MVSSEQSKSNYSIRGVPHLTLMKIVWDVSTSLSEFTIYAVAAPAFQFPIVPVETAEAGVILVVPAWVNGTKELLPVHFIAPIEQQ